MFSREIVFNDASLQGVDERAAGALIAQMAQEVAVLVALRSVDRTMRLSRPFNLLAVGQSNMWDMLLSLVRSRHYLEEAQFLMGLSHKSPLIDGLGIDVSGRFFSCEPSPADESHNALVLCAITGAVAASLESSPKWSGDRLEVVFDEIFGDERLETRFEYVDNVSKADHGRSVADRRRQLAAAYISRRDFWINRGAACPDLEFGRDIQGQISALDEATFSLVITRLLELNASVQEWKREGGARPLNRSCVTRESRSTMSDPRLVAARTFRDSRGVSAVFEWHARFGSGGRIHFLLDEVDKSIEVGYIGPHLPL